MQNLTEEKVCQLAMSPLYVLHLVAAPYLAPKQVTERQIVRAIEYGLKWESPFSEGVFELLRAHLHEFYATFPDGGVFHPGAEHDWKAELGEVRDLLGQLTGPKGMIEDFKTALKNLALFVAGGGAFRQQLDDPDMQARAAWVCHTFAD